MLIVRSFILVNSKETRTQIQHLRRDIRLPISLGIGPPMFVVGLGDVGIPSNSSTCIVTINPISVGMVPAMKLFDKTTSRMAGSKPTSEGIAPEMKFELRLMTSNPTISPTFVGMELNKELRFISRIAARRKRLVRYAALASLGNCHSQLR